MIDLTNLQSLKKWVSILTVVFMMSLLLIPADAEPQWFTIQDTDPLIKFNGGWAVWPGDTGDSDASVQVSDGQIGRSMEYTFAGTGIQIIGRKHYWSGIVEVTIDDVSQGTFDLYSGGSEYQQLLFEKTGLTDTVHTLKVEVVALHGDDASAGRMFIDCLKVQGEYSVSRTQVNGNSEDVQIIGSGWQYWPDQGDLSGGAQVSDGSFAYGERSVVFEFFGTDVQVMGRNHMLGGLVEIFVDNVSEGVIDLYSADTYYRKILFSKWNLEADWHTVKLVQKGVSPQNSGGARILLDCFFYANRSDAQPTNPDTLVWNTVENDSPQVYYNNESMSIWPDSGSSGDSVSVSNDVVGNSAEFTFYGSQIQYVVQQHTLTGLVSIYIDDIYQGDVDTFGYYVKQVVAFEKSDLPEGTHTIKVVLKDHSPQDSGKNSCRLMLDCFRYASYTMQYSLDSVSLTGTTASVSLSKLGSNNTAPILIVASFNNQDEMLGAALVPVVVGQSDYQTAVAPETTYVKAFLWKDMASMLPVTAAISSK